SRARSAAGCAPRTRRSWTWAWPSKAAGSTISRGTCCRQAVRSAAPKARPFAPTNLPLERSHPGKAGSLPMLLLEESADLTTPTGVMRTHLFRPTGDGRYPALILYSEIFQLTGPVRRMAALFAG